MEHTNSLFTPVAGSTQKLFSSVNPIKGAQGTAINAVAEYFTSIDRIMTEGKVAPAHLEYATQKLYDAFLAVEKAIGLGWNNGQGSQY